MPSASDDESSDEDDLPLSRLQRMGTSLELGVYHYCAPDAQPYCPAAGRLKHVSRVFNLAGTAAGLNGSKRTVPLRSASAPPGSLPSTGNGAELVLLLTWQLRVVALEMPLVMAKEFRAQRKRGSVVWLHGRLEEGGGVLYDDPRLAKTKSRKFDLTPAFGSSANFNGAFMPQHVLQPYPGQICSVDGCNECFVPPPGYMYPMPGEDATSYYQPQYAALQTPMSAFPAPMWQPTLQAPQHYDGYASGVAAGEIATSTPGPSSQGYSIPPTLSGNSVPTSQLPLQANQDVGQLQPGSGMTTKGALSSHSEVGESSGYAVEAAHGGTQPVYGNVPLAESGGSTSADPSLGGVLAAQGGVEYASQPSLPASQGTFPFPPADMPPSEAFVCTLEGCQCSSMLPSSMFLLPAPPALGPSLPAFPAKCRTFRSTQVEVQLSADAKDSYFFSVYVSQDAPTRARTNTHEYYSSEIMLCSFPPGTGSWPKARGGPKTKRLASVGAARLRSQSKRRGARAPVPLRVRHGVALCCTESLLWCPSTSPAFECCMKDLSCRVPLSSMCSPRCVAVETMSATQARPHSYPHAHVTGR